MRKTFFFTGGWIFVYCVLMASSLWAQGEPACTVTAKILEIEKRIIRERAYDTKTLQGVTFKIELKSRGMPLAQNAKDACRDFQKGKQLNVFAIKERDFENPALFEDLKINTALEGELRQIGEGRSKQFIMTDIRILGVYRKIQDKS
jgi:hypothetical protein